MSYMTNYFENVVRDTITSNTLYVGLMSDTVDVETAAGTEMSGNGYSRQSVTFNTTANAGELVSAADITFTATADYTALSFVLYDAATGGNALFARKMSPKTVTSSEPFTIAAGAITITLD